MTVISIPKALREKLGDEATDAFVEVIKAIDLDSRKELATKTDIAKLDGKIDKVKSELDGELNLLKWMVGIMLAGVISLVLKAFFM